MKAVVIKEFNAPLVTEEVPAPVVEPGWVLVKPRACGLCGTDLKIASGVLPMVRIPLIPGHEVAGEVVEVGKGVTNVAPGDRVAIYLYIPCGQCPACRRGWDALCSNLAGMIGFNVNGGCADLMKAPAANVFRIPDHVSFEEAAVLADAVATTYHALMRRAQAQAGQTVVMLGVGGLGLHAIQIAKIIGLRILAVDVDQAHLDMASKLGAEIVINPAKEDLKELITNETNGKGVDLVLEMSGNPQVAADGVFLLKPRGRMVLMGYHPVQPFEVSSITVVLKELEICGSRASTKQDFAEVIDWVGAGKIKPIIHEVMPLSQINEAHKKLKGGKVVGRLVLKP